MENIILDKFTLTNPIGKEIRGDVRSTGDAALRPMLFVLHGFKGFKDWGFFPYICEEFARCGLITVCFNFSLNGMREGSDRVEAPGDFALNTISQEVADTLFVLRNFTARGNFLPERVYEQWNGDIYLLGHSRGGGVAVISAGREPSVKRLALWNSVAQYDRYTERQKQFWREYGHMEVENSRTHQTLRMNLAYLNDVEENRDNFDLERILNRLDIPVLIVHGEQDMTVQLREGERLAHAAKNARLEIIPRTGHTFGAVHPFESSNAALDSALDETCSFFGLV